MTMTQGYDLLNRTIEDFRAIFKDESIPAEAKVNWGRAVLDGFDRERGNMIAAHEDYRREIGANGR